MKNESLVDCYKYLVGTLYGTRDLVSYLPSKAPYCSRCQYFREHTLDRFSCRLDERWLIIDPRKERDADCPIEWKEEN